MKTKIDLINNYLVFFERRRAEYNISFAPGAITDFFENENDTLVYKLKTRKYDDYEIFELNLTNAKYPLIIQLVLSTGEMKYEKYESNNSKINFDNIDPGKYYIKNI